MEASQCPEVALEGIAGRPVCAIHERDIVAMASDTEVVAFDRFEQQELLGYVAQHQGVLDALFRTHDLVPFSFGIIVPSRAEVNDLLRQVYLQFKVTLERVRGKAEFAVQVRWEGNRVLEEVAREHLAAVGPQRGDDLPALPRALADRLEARRMRFVREIRDVLRSRTEECREGKLLEPNMVGNFALLIDRAAEPALDATMQELGVRYGAHLRFKYIGPMSPYSFTSMNLRLGNAELIDQARVTLGLGLEATWSQVQRAYHQRARACHPDRHGGTAGATEAMREVNEAYRILEEYCQSQDATTSSQERAALRTYSFQPEDVRRCFVVHART